jgi:hypothetical protein
MTIGSKEHYDILESFEKSFSDYRLDKENKELWKKGQVYQSGETNKLYQAVMMGYSMGRINYLS